MIRGFNSVCDCKFHRSTSEYTENELANLIRVDLHTRLNLCEAVDDPEVTELLERINAEVIN